MERGAIKRGGEENVCSPANLKSQIREDKDMSEENPKSTPKKWMIQSQNGQLEYQIGSPFSCRENQVSCFSSTEQTI